MKRILVAISFLVLLVLLGFGCASNTAAIQHSYAVLPGLNPEDSAILSSFDTVVIDAQYFTKDEIAAIQAKGTSVYTYLNIASSNPFEMATKRSKS